MYYVIEEKYVGPNPEQHVRDKHRFLISEGPGQRNMSGEPATEGWLGTTNDWARYARGEFSSLENARQFIIQETMEDCRTPKESSGEYDPHILIDFLEEWRVGYFPSMSAQESTEWAWDGAYNEISPEMPDTELADLFWDFQRECRDNMGMLLDITTVWSLFTAVREEKQEMDEENA